jgi:predicted permease
MTNGLIGDLRFALRYLLARRAFTATLVVSLALAIGANTAVFSIVDAVLFGSLPVTEPDRLVAVYTLDEKNPGHLPVSDHNSWDIREQASDILDVAQFSFAAVDLERGEDRDSLPALVVTSNYFDVLGVSMLVGRGFDHDDHALGGHPEVVLTHRTWLDVFGRDPEVLGRRVVINGSRFTIVGVVPEPFTGTGPGEAAVFLPYSSHRELGKQLPWFGDRRWLAFSPIARLQDDVTLEQVEGELERIGRRLAATYPDMNRGRTFTAVPLSQAVLGPDQRDRVVQAGAMMMTIVGFVLLIACANVANLLLARASSRRAEVALRRVLGAKTSRIIRQLLTESLLLAMIAALIGLVLAVPLRELMWSLRPDGFALGGIRPEIDGRVLLFTATIASATGLLFGLAPAVRLARNDLLAPLQEETTPIAAVGARFGARSVLVVLQVALSMVALVGAGLFMRSMDNARDVDLGLRPESVLLATVDAQSLADEPGPRLKAILGEVGGLPEIEAVALTSRAPLAPGGGVRRTTYVDGRDSPAEDGVLLDVFAIEGLYFDAVGQPVVEGRSIQATDEFGKTRVVVVNETFVRRYWPEGGAIGKQLRFNGEAEPLTIVGVVGAAKMDSPMDEPTPALYVSLLQWPQPVVTLVARTRGDPLDSGPVVADSIRASGRDVRVSDFRSLEQVIELSLRAPRAGALLLGLCGLVALGLASVGLYGVMAYAVRQRAREIGIRMALGARPGHVLRFVLFQALSLVGFGAAAGGLGALLLQQRFAALLFEVPLGDPWAFCGALVVLVSTATVAGYIPARHATRINPARAIHHD